VLDLWVSSIAAVLTTASFVPQALLVIRSRNTEGISLAMYLMLNVGIAMWLVYGLLIKAPAVIAANAITLPFTLIILVMTLQARAKGSADVKNL
jgi:MtN3 and saliva related transmembrane protein